MTVTADNAPCGDGGPSSQKKTKNLPRNKLTKTKEEPEVKICIQKFPQSNYGAYVSPELLPLQLLWASFCRIKAHTHVGHGSNWWD